MIRKSALLIFKTIDQTKHLMMVRAEGNDFFLLPGGKQEPHETIQQALRREIEEELACSAKNISLLEKVAGHTPDGRPLTISLFTGSLEGAPKPSSEIKEIVWVSRKNIPKYKKDFTPITISEIFPCLARYNLF